MLRVAGELEIPVAVSAEQEATALASVMDCWEEKRAAGEAALRDIEVTSYIHSVPYITRVRDESIPWSTR